MIRHKILFFFYENIYDFVFLILSVSNQVDALKRCWMCLGRQLLNLVIKFVSRGQCVETRIQLKKDDLAESSVLLFL